MFKKHIATIIALTLILSLMPALPVWAANPITGMNTAINPFTVTPNFDTIANGEQIQLQLVDNLFTFGAGDVSTVEYSDLTTAGVAITGTVSTIATGAFSVSGGHVYVMLTFSTAPGDYNVPLTSANNTLGITTTSFGATASLVTCTGSIEAKPAAIRTISGSDTVTGITLVQGTNSTPKTSSAVFTKYDNTPTTFNDATIAPYVATAVPSGTGVGYFDWERNGNDFVLKAHGDATPGTYTFTLTFNPATAATSTSTTTGSYSITWNNVTVTPAVPSTSIQTVSGTGNIAAFTLTQGASANVPAAGLSFTTYGGSSYSSLSGLMVGSTGTGLNGTFVTAALTGTGSGNFVLSRSGENFVLKANTNAVVGDYSDLKITFTTTNAAITTTSYVINLTKVTVSNAIPTTGAIISGIADGFNSTSNYWISDTGNRELSIDITDLAEEDVFPGDEIYIHFNPSFFTWDGGTPNTGVITNKNLSDGKITFKAGSLSTYIESASLKTISNSERVISVIFKEPLVATKAVTIKSSTIDVLYDKKSNSSNSPGRIVLGGVIVNREQDIDNGMDNADFADGPVFVADGSISKIELYLDNGVYLTAKNLRNGAKVYGYTSMEPESSDDSVFDKYDVDEVVHLYTVGLNGSNNTVVLEMDENYYVYDPNMNYLGRSDSKTFPYFTKYYLSISDLKIPMAGDPTSDPTQINDPTAVGGTGGTGATNGNMNPYTGR